jgi:hypothetical protein
MGRVEDVVGVAFVLVKEDVGGMTGVPVPVDGGYFLH